VCVYVSEILGMFERKLYVTMRFFRLVYMCGVCVFGCVWVCVCGVC